MRSSKLMSFFVAAFATIALAAGARGQATKNAWVRVLVHDSTNRPVPGAQLIVSQGLHNTVLETHADSLGVAVFSVPVIGSGEYEITSRKIGYIRDDRFFTMTHSDTTELTMVEGVSPSTLDAVKVTAKRDNARFNSYVLDADDIEATDENIPNAWETVKKLRPVMLTSRGGCPGAQNVWVNGYWVRNILPAARSDLQRARMTVPAGARFSNSVVAILDEIAPEHIERVEYKDCNDTSMAVVGSRNAIFITLKQGVDYRPGMGSFVLDLPGERE